MAKQEPEYLLRVTIDVLYRASQEQITTFLLGEFPTVRAAEKLRDCLCRYNPDKLFLANYQNHYCGLHLYYYNCGYHSYLGLYAQSLGSKTK